MRSLPILLALATLVACSGPGDDGDGGLPDGWDGETDPGDQERLAWGWITAIEPNDVPCDDIHAEWCGPVRAYFAVEPSYSRSLPHHLDFICAALQTAGGCTLYGDCNNERRSCAGICGPDEECVGSECLPLPKHWNVGEIGLAGLKREVRMAADDFDRYEAAGMPGDLFDAGDDIAASVAGGELAPFSLSARGVADIQVPSATLTLTRGQPAAIGWTPSGVEARVQVLLLSGWHYPFLPAAALLCDAADGDSPVEVPASMVDEFLDRSPVFMRYSRIMRYTRDATTPFGKEIELVVGSTRLLTIAVQ